MPMIELLHAAIWRSELKPHVNVRPRCRRWDLWTGMWQDSPEPPLHRAHWTSSPAPGESHLLRSCFIVFPARPR